MMLRIMTCLDSTGDVSPPPSCLPLLSATHEDEDLWTNKLGEMKGFGNRVGGGIKKVCENSRIRFYGAAINSLDDFDELL